MRLNPPMLKKHTSSPSRSLRCITPKKLQTWQKTPLPVQPRCRDRPHAVSTKYPPTANQSQGAEQFLQKNRNN